MKRNIEVLAPAGSYETLKAAIESGADAVYVGGSRFGARAFAQNFMEEELLDAIDYVHLRGKKILLTVNTLIKEKEFEDYLLPYYERGLDAVIVQDMGVLTYVKKQFPEMDVHASTQMTITNAVSAEYLELIGVSRVVPARELSLNEVNEIARKTNLESECFVHGALCYCYSGQCLMSSMIGGRSGNRGQCAQPCRLPYKVDDTRQPIDIMSLKDLCTIEHIPDLIEAGITSFKIEGRMKQPSYVAAVTSMYRKYVDLYNKKGRKGFHVSKDDIDILMQAYKRRGYCDGYYYRHNGKEMISFGRPINESDTQWDGVEGKVQEQIKGNLVLVAESNAALFIEYKDINLEVFGDVVDYAKKQPMTDERIRKQMNKTGNTPFKFEVLDIFMSDDIFVPVQTLNELRREGLLLLEERIKETFRRTRPDKISIETREEYSGNPLNKFAVSIETVDQLKVCASSKNINIIYIEDYLCYSTNGSTNELNDIKKYINTARDNGIAVYFSMARIFRDEAISFYERHLKQLEEIFDGALTRNLEEILYLKNKGFTKPFISDSSAYQWNRNAKQFWNIIGTQCTTAPVELNYHELKELGTENMELIVYGYLPVMVTAGCIQKNTSKCTKTNSMLILSDRYQKKFFVKNICNYCYNVIYNVAPLMLVDQKDEITALNPYRMRLQFTKENAIKTQKILEIYSDVFIHGKDADISDMEFTRGHFKRGVK